MKRLVWHQGLVILQDDDDGRWRSHGARKPLPGETADQFPKLLDPPKPRIHDPLEGFEI